MAEMQKTHSVGILVVQVPTLMRVRPTCQHSLVIKLPTEGLDLLCWGTEAGLVNLQSEALSGSRVFPESPTLLDTMALLVRTRCPSRKVE